MSGPTLNDPKTQTVELYDLDVVSAAGAAPGVDWTPRTGFSFARSFIVNTAGTIKVDLIGVAGGNSAPTPAVGQTLTVAANVMYYIGVKKIYAAGSTVQGVTVFY